MSDEKKTLSLYFLITHYSSLITSSCPSMLILPPRKELERGRGSTNGRRGGVEARGGEGRGAERRLQEGVGARRPRADADSLRRGDCVGRDCGEARRPAVVLLAARNRDLLPAARGR